MPKPVTNPHPPFKGSVIYGPDAFVRGETITQWVEDYIRFTFKATFDPAQSTVNDPTGSVADALNPRGGQMYFITGGPSGSERPFLLYPHQARIAHDVGRQNCRQAPLDPFLRHRRRPYEVGKRLRRGACRR
jgi:hypothetical protein